jgi:hypothetical protein
MSLSLKQLVELEIKKNTPVKPPQKFRFVWPSGIRERRTCIAWFEAVEAAGFPFEVVDSTTTCPAKQDIVKANSVPTIADTCICIFCEDDLDKAQGGTKPILVLSTNADTKLNKQYDTEKFIYNSESKYSELWIPPQISTFAPVIAKCYGKVLCRIMPQIWSPSAIPMDQTLTYNAVTKSSEGGVDIVIVGGSHFSQTWNPLTSLVICDCAEELKAGTIRNIFIINPKCDDIKINNWKANAEKFPNLESKIFWITAEEDEIVPFFHSRDQVTYFLHHQVDRTEFPDLLWHLGYCGFPVFHNLKTTMQFGVRYIESDIVQASKLLTVDKSSFSEAYTERNRSALKIMMPQSAIDKIKDVMTR